MLNVPVICGFRFLEQIGLGPIFSRSLSLASSGNILSLCRNTGSLLHKLIALCLFGVTGLCDYMCYLNQPRRLLKLCHRST
jgi:hypothetical protein